MAESHRRRLHSSVGPRNDRGSILPLVAAVVAVGVLGFVFGARLAARTIDVARAESAAEAAALAGAMGLDPTVAAAENGAELVAGEWKSDSGAYEARTRLRRAHGTALARPSSDPLAGGFGGAPGAGDRRGLAPETLAALARADAALARRGLPSPVPVVSGYRSHAEQLALWLRRDSNPYPVAPPGKSAHNLGLAVDVPRSWVAHLLAVASEAGLCQPFPDRDPIHFGPVESPECGGRASGSAGKALLIWSDAYL